MVTYKNTCCCPVTKSCPTLCNPTLCPPVPRRVCSDSCPSSRGCYLTISFSAAPFCICFQSFPASESFQMSQLYASGGQSIGASASALVFPMNIQGWFPIWSLVWSPCCPRDSQESFLAPQFESISSSVLSFLYGPTLTSIHDLLEKP